MSTQNPTTVTVQDKAEQAVAGFQQKGAREQLAMWITEHVTEWERWRKEHLDPKWAVYLRKWRGLWEESDRTRQSERSRLISPALQEAVEEAVAEMEEAVFGDKEAWFDVDDDLSDGTPEAWQRIRAQALDDMSFVNVEGAILEAGGLMNAVYGTAIGKVVVDVREDHLLRHQLDEAKNQIVSGVAEVERIAVFLEPVRPDHFVIDTAVNKPGKEGIAMALGMAHRLPRPRHALLAKMASGNYWEVPLDGEQVQQALSTELGVLKTATSEDCNLVSEYHGLVPRVMLDAAVKDGEAVDEIDSRDLVEAICTVVDDKYLVAARENTNLKKDRDFVAAPFDLVPGSFWGRGICEKGINSQRTIDAQLRAGVDGLGFTVHPMLGVNSQRRDPRHKVEVGPGKVLYANGDPREVFFPFNFGRIDPTIFTAISQLDSFVQRATGSAGSAIRASAARSGSTLGVASLIQGSVAKRYKRTLRLLEQHFLKPFVEKFVLRHMQWNEESYPFVDVRFRVRTGLSMIAREAENNTLVQVLQTVPPQSPVFYAILGQIVTNSSAKDKDMVMQAIQAVLSGQAPGSAEDAQGGEDPERKALEKEEIGARTEQKKAQTAKIYKELLSGSPKPK